MPTDQIDIANCRQRQQRLVDELKQLDVDLAIVCSVEAVKWLTGFRTSPMFAPVVAIDSQGTVTAVVPDSMQQAPCAADNVLGYEAQWHSTLRNDQPAASMEILAAELGGAKRRVACEFSQRGSLIRTQMGDADVDVEPLLYRLRRYKHDDELRLMRRAIDANACMYSVAREIIVPGINELAVYSRLHAAAVEELGEPLTYFGQDFQSGSRGGPPRDRHAKAGELYILDLGVGYRGYFSDTSRAIAVGGDPTDAQQRAAGAVCEVFDLITSNVRPGVKCRDIFDEAQELLDRHKPWVFDHHLGHGVGLYPHEAPHLNPHWDDRFEDGDVFTVEPGLYHDDLRTGVRLEQNFCVTATGVELLTNFDLRL